MVITYETLFELLRIEKNREDIQKLDPDFFEGVLKYLVQCKTESQVMTGQTSIFETDEAERSRLEFENLKKILKDLYDRREKKIVNMALSRSRTGVNLVNLQNILPQERLLFNSVNSTLLDFRKNILFKIACGEIPVDLNETNIRGLRCNSGNQEKKGLDGPSEALRIEVIGGTEEKETENTVEETKELKTDPNLNKNTENHKKVRFLASIDEIIGPDLEVYGPYSEGAVISLPRELARVLIEKRQAEES